LYLLIPFIYPAVPSFPLPLVLPGTMEATQGVTGLVLTGRWFHWKLELHPLILATVLGRSGLPFPSPGNLPNPGIEPTSAWQADSLPLSHLGMSDNGLCQ